MAESNTAILRKPKTQDRTLSGTETLNFKVAPDFKREFKVYAASQGISMVDLLKEGFALSRRQKRK